MADQASEDSPILDRGSLVGAEGGMGRRIGIEVIDAHNLVVGTRGQVFSISREAHRVDGARVVAHSRQLFGLGVVCIGAIADRVRRPDSHMSIYQEAILACLLLFR